MIYACLSRICRDLPLSTKNTYLISAQIIHRGPCRGPCPFGRSDNNDDKCCAGNYVRFKGYLGINNMRHRRRRHKIKIKPMREVAETVR